MAAVAAAAAVAGSDAVQVAGRDGAAAKGSAVAEAPNQRTPQMLRCPRRPSGNRLAFPGGRLPASAQCHRPTPVARIDEAACILCGACQATCPTQAITLSEDAVSVNLELCRGCGGLR